MRVEQGQAAPDFTLPSDDGTTFTLSQALGRPVVIFVYPQDNTPTCTIEAKDFSAEAAAFAAKGAVLVGLSPDSLKRHENFRAKHGLTVPLLSDPDHVMLEPYGLWVEKSTFGRTYMGVERTTILIDAQGVIARIWRKVRVKGHVEEVLAALDAL